MGLGGAIVAPVTLSVLSATFVTGAERNRAMGAWGAMGGVGGVTGVIAGGLITQYLGWEWTLFINVPIGIVCAVVAARVLEHDERPEERRNFDALGAVVITSGLTLLTYGIVSTHEHGWTSAQTLIPMVAGVVLIAVFVLIERFVATRPLVDFSIFRARPVIGSNVVVFTLGAGAFAMWFLLSLYLQHVRLYSPVDAGLAMMPGALGVVGGSLLAARLTTRFGGGWVMTGGMALLAGGLAVDLQCVAARLTGARDHAAAVRADARDRPHVRADDDRRDGQGQGRNRPGLASGVLNTSRQFGGTLSIAVLVTIAASRTASLTVPGHPPTRAALSAGYMHGLAVGAAFAAVGALAGVPARGQRADTGTGSRRRRCRYTLLERRFGGSSGSRPASPRGAGPRMTTPTPLFAGRVAVVGDGRLGNALAGALRDAGLSVDGPLGRGATADEADVVLLCVPDREIAAAAALIAPTKLVGHCSGAEHARAAGRPRGVLASPADDRHRARCAAARRRRRDRRDHAACPRGGAGARRRRRPACRRHRRRRPCRLPRRRLDRLELPRDVEGAAEELLATTGADRELLVALVRATIDNWAADGAAALTGPIARGDEQTVARQREAVAQRTPHLLELFDALAAATRELATHGAPA